MKTKTATPTLTKNIVQFRSKFVNLPNAGENNRQMAVTVLSELLQFGYVLSNDAVENIASRHGDIWNEKIDQAMKGEGYE